MEQTRKSKILVGIPAYNEEQTIAKVVLLAKQHSDKVVVIDDGSQDMTAQIAEALGAEVIRHETNMGYGAALRTIFKTARKENCDILVILDGDGQHDPREIPKLIEPILKNEADVVIGSRFLGKTDIKKYRAIGVKTITKITNIITKLNITDAQSGFRAYNRKAIETIMPTDDGMGASIEILTQIAENKLKIKEVPITIKYQGLDTSTHNPIRHGAGVINTLITKTIEKRPLLYLGGIGIFLFLIGLNFMLLLIQIFNTTRYFSIPLSIISIGFLLAGLMMMTTAVTAHMIKNIEKKLN